MNHGLVRAGLGVLLIATILLAFRDAYQVPFLFDDPHSIEANESIRQMWPPEHWFGARKETTAAGRPLVNLSLAVNYACGELDPEGYHAFNVGVHLLAALVLFSLLGRLARRAGASDRAASGLAVAVTLCWAVHPLQAHSVTYVIQRAETLMGLCLFTALWAAARGFESVRPGAWYVLTVVVCLVGLGAKEVMAVVPLLVLLMDRTFFAGSFRQALGRRGLYAGLALTWVVFAVVLSMGARTGTVGFGFEDVTPLLYFKVQIVLVARYLWLVFDPRGMAIDYGWPPEPAVTELILPGLVLGGLFAGTVMLVVRRHALGFAGACFFLVLAPSSSILPVSSEIGAEHRMHVPLAAVVAVLVTLVGMGGGLVEWKRSAVRRWGGVVLTLAVVVGLAFGLDRRHLVLADPVALWESDLRVWPGNPRAYAQLSGALLQAHEVPAALERLRSFVAEQDEDPRLLRAIAERMQENAPPRVLLVFLDESLRRQPSDADTWFRAAEQYERLSDTARQVEHLLGALEVDPRHDAAATALGLLRARQDKVVEAIRWLTIATEEGPPDVAALGNLGIAYQRAGQLAKARDALVAAVAVDPDNLDLRLTLARLYQSLGEWDLALEQCREILAREAGHDQAERLQKRVRRRRNQESED